MSSEAMEWLNRNVLIGYTDKRGHAWHYRASAQGGEPNHYPGPVPVEDVRRRLFDWTCLRGRVLVHTDTHGLQPDSHEVAVVASDNGDVLGYFTEDYEIHQYQDWLLEKVVSILDDGLSIGSAGLLKDRKQAWVSVEVPDSITTPEGVEFRPHLLACTSHDGSLKSTYKRVVTNVVCDNTMAAGLSETGQVIKFKHSKNSRFRTVDVRNALQIVMTAAEEFQAEVRALCQVDVSERAWQQFLQAHLPAGDSPRSQTRARNLRGELHGLWTSDQRVTPWRNTAWGVLQAVNTHKHHYAPVRGATRAERNFSRAVGSEIRELDTSTIATLDNVLAAV
jgi:phage/plasmid-like protein (TIGR03299 family)